MIAGLFYLLGLIFILGESYSGSHSKKLVEFRDQIKRLGKSRARGSSVNMTTEITIYFLFHLFYMLWLILGILIASQWKIFTCFLIFAFISGGIYKITPQRFKYVIIVIDSIISSLALFYMIFNHFHHINLFPI